MVIGDELGGEKGKNTSSLFFVFLRVFRVFRGQHNLSFF